MIKFKVDDVEGIYLDLLSPRTKRDALETLLDTLGESWKANVKDKVGQRTLDYMPFSSDKISFPSPLETMNYSFWSNGIFYKIASQIVIVETETFGNIQRRISDKIKKDNTLETYKGVIRLSGEDPILVFSASYPSLDINLGGKGTMKRKLGNLEQFEADVKGFTDFLGEVVNSAYEKEVPSITYSL